MLVTGHLRCDRTLQDQGSKTGAEKRGGAPGARPVPSTASVGGVGTCLADARAGANLQTALQGLADRTGLVSLARFVDGIVVAVERVTMSPLIRE